MKKLFLAVLFGLSFIAVNAQTTTQKMEVGEFMKINIDGPLNVDYVYCPDSAGIAFVTGMPDRIAWVEARVKGDELRLKLQQPDSLKYMPAGPKPSVKVYSSFLTAVVNNGDSTVRVLSTVNVPKFSAKVVGNGRISIHDIQANEVTLTQAIGHGALRVAGKCKDLSINLLGNGTVEAEALESTKCSIKYGGKGNIGVWANEKISVVGIGSGTVYFLGSPQIKNSAIGVSLQHMTE